MWRFGFYIQLARGVTLPDSPPSIPSVTPLLTRRNNLLCHCLKVLSV